MNYHFANMLVAWLYSDLKLCDKYAQSSRGPAKLLSFRWTSVWLGNIINNLVGTTDLNMSALCNGLPLCFT